MSKYKKGQSSSQKTDDEAEKIALGIKKNGQTKDQTKLIAQGIKKGIEIYKKQQNSKNREIDKNRKLANKQKNSANTDQPPSQIVQYKQHWLPWALLTLTWVGVGVGVYFVIL